MHATHILLKAGVIVQLVNSFDEHTLHRSGNRAIVDLLLNYEVSIEIDYHGRMLLDELAWRGFCRRCLQVELASKLKTNLGVRHRIRPLSTTERVKRLTTIVLWR